MATVFGTSGQVLLPPYRIEVRSEQRVERLGCRVTQPPEVVAGPTHDLHALHEDEQEAGHSSRSRTTSRSMMVTRVSMSP